MANLNNSYEAKKAILEQKIIDVLIPSFLERIILDSFECERPDDYHDQYRVQGRMAEYLKGILLKQDSLSTILDILEDEERDCYDSGCGWQGDVALTLQASIMMRLKIFDARHSTGVVRKNHMKSARQWRKAIDYAGI